MVASIVVSAADQARLRQPTQYSKWGILVFRPTIIATATISGSPGQGATEINLTGYSETETPAQYYSVIVGDSSGDDSGGKVRLKSLNGGGSSISVATNNIEWSSYTTISILKVIEPTAILPDLSNDKMDDDVAYTDENSKYRPLARIGPPAWGYAGEAIPFWSNSRAYNSGNKTFSDSVSSHAWTFPSGSPSSSTSAGSSSNPIEVTWADPTGHVPYYVKYVATDANGKTHTRYNPVWIIEDFSQDLYCNFSVDSISGSYDEGAWSGKIEVKGDATTSEFPQDAMIMIVAEDWYAGEKISVGGNWIHRENVIFVGWIVKDTVFKDADTGHVSFDVYGTMKKLSQITDWPANLEAKASPAHWNELKDMTCDLAALHILRERTTMDFLVDINLTSNTKTLKYVDIPETTVNVQLDDYCLSPIGARALSDRQGQIYFSRNPNLRPLDERSISTVMELEFDDMRADPGMELGEEDHEYRCAQVDFIGFTYDGLDTTPIYSLAPARQHPTGRIEKVDGIRVDSQDEANELSGMYLANFNNIWNQNRFPLFNYRVFDIVPEYYVTLSLSASDTKRGIVWDQQKLIVRDVDISFNEEDEAIEVEIGCEKDSFGPPGVGGGYATSIDKESSPTPVPTQPGLALAGWGSFYFRKEGDTSWTDRSPSSTTPNFGCVDPWWFSRYKQNTLDPDMAIVYMVLSGGSIYRSSSGGRSWSILTLTEPGNDWSDSPAPTLSDLNLVWIAGDMFRNGRFYVLAEWQNSGDDWRGWIGITDDDFTTFTWYPIALNDAETITNLRPLGVEATKDNVLITAWVEGGSGSPRLRLYIYDPNPYAFGGEWALGDASEAEVTAKTYIAYPLATELPEEWFIYGRMSTPAGLGDDPAHIIRYNLGVWSTIISNWSTDICGSFRVGSEENGVRRYYAVRNS